MVDFYKDGESIVHRKLSKVRVKRAVCLKSLAVEGERIATRLT